LSSQRFSSYPTGVLSSDVFEKRSLAPEVKSQRNAVTGNLPVITKTEYSTSFDDDDVDKQHD